MESAIKIHLKKLLEGFYLATSTEIQGLVAQGRTIWETIEIARDVARKLLEAQKERNIHFNSLPTQKEFDLPLFIEN